jgi:hypothetical protein
MCHDDRHFRIVAHNGFFPTIDQRRRDLGYQSKTLFLLDEFGFHHTE